MPTPTTNPVPSSSPSDLLFNAEKLDEAISGTADSYTDRLGVARLTMHGAMKLIGYEVPVVFASGLSITRATQTVISSGLTYHANPASLPFTTTGSFVAGQWLLISNVTAQDLASIADAAGGAALIGYNPVKPYSNGLGYFLNFRHARTAGEIAAGVTPTNYAYDEGDVRRYGAVGDGSTDDTAAIARAVLAVPAKGGTIYFPQGQTFKGTLVINKNNVRVEGYGAELLNDGTGPGILAYISGAVIEGTYIYGLTVNGNGSSQPGVVFKRSTRSRIEDYKIAGFKGHGVYITGDGIGGVTQVVVGAGRIDAHGSRAAGSAGIYVGDNGVSTTVRALFPYITGYQQSVMDHGVNTVLLGAIYESGTNAVITDGGAMVSLGDWVESATFTGKHFRIGDARTTIMAPHPTTIADIDAYATGQFPSRENKLMVYGGSVLSNLKVVDGGIQNYYTAVGGSLNPNGPRNLRGYAEITGAVTTFTATFNTAEPDASYYVALTPVASAGSPATGSNRVVSVSKSTIGFTVTVEVAPGAAKTVGFDWVITR